METNPPSKIAKPIPPELATEVGSPFVRNYFVLTNRQMNRLCLVSTSKLNETVLAELLEYEKHVIYVWKRSPKTRITKPIPPELGTEVGSAFVRKQFLPATPN